MGAGSITNNIVLKFIGIYADMWEQRFKNDGESADDGNPIAD